MNPDYKITLHWDKVNRKQIPFISTKTWQKPNQYSYTSQPVDGGKDFTSQSVDYFIIVSNMCYNNSGWTNKYFIKTIKVLKRLKNNFWSNVIEILTDRN